METWEYLLIQVLRGLEGQWFQLTPPQPGLESDLDDVGPGPTVTLLDELGHAGWELVSVDSEHGPFWLKRRKTGG